MKVLISTVFYTENCGSVLQAFALKKIIEQHGIKVYHLQTKNRYSAHSLKMLVKNAAKALFRGENVLGQIIRYCEFDTFIKQNFSIAKYTEGIDRMIIGSDTVWDVMSPYFMDSQDAFWGKGIPGNKVVVYGASVANSTYEKLNELQYPSEAVKGYRAVSVRDEYTRTYVKQFAGRESIMVCDPTLLLSRETYESIGKRVEQDPYLLLYLFDEPGETVKREVTEFAAERGLKIIALGKKIHFANRTVTATVENFLGLYASAAYVVTNTFHGTVFSFIFRKPFAVLDYHKKKITDFLSLTALQERLAKEGDRLSEILGSPADFEQAEKRLNVVRKISTDFLKENIWGVGHK